MATETRQELEKKIQILTEDLTVLENYVSSLFVFLPIPICFSSPKGVILEFNPAFEELTGYKAFETVGKNLSLIFGDETTQDVLEDILSHGEITAKEAQVIRSSKETVVISIFARTRQDSDKRVIGFFLTIFDLTEIKKTEEALGEKLKELERFQKIAVGRELKMVDLKSQIVKLKE